MKWFFSEFHGHIIARAPDGTTYRVPDGNMNSAPGITMLNAMARALSKPNEEAQQAIDGIAELEQEARLMRARMDRMTDLVQRLRDMCGNDPNTIVTQAADEVESLLNGMYNIANQSTEPAIKEFARSYLEAKQ